MKENGIAKALQIIGIIVVVCGVILGFITLTGGEEFSWLGIVEIIAGFITCMVFMGFAEIIDLLQKNSNKQDALLTFLKEEPEKNNTAQKFVLQDIESNLPEM